MPDAALMKILPKTLILSPLFCFSKKRLFEEIAAAASGELELPQKVLVSILNEREDQGSTVFFDLAALPHALLPEEKPTLGVLSILDKAVPFNSFDADLRLVDITYTLFINPSDDYDEAQQLLLSLSSVLANLDLLNALRQSRNETAKINLILEKLDALLVRKASDQKQK